MTADSAASPFDPLQQNNPPDLDHKIVASLERLAGVFRHLLWQEATHSGLSPLQLQVVVFLRFHLPSQCTVSNLAREYHVSRATISDAVKTLAQKSLISRHPDPVDLRSHFLKLTPAGERLADQTSRFAAPLGQPVAGLPTRQKQSLYLSLLTLLYELQAAGTIPVQRMCFSCRHYGWRPGQHFCHLLNIPLEGPQLRIDCPEHDAAL
ncbi:MarR family winged helix-turn-helix transcriptional regulator [Hymenobacter sp. GOD-10R]|uniref:MarR family winged helix-turn-helix transcriptional regulator n=1 Tax=Hymenobacter sp. GOD-10R TaxID=3093922 RepID=UPI002D790F17|nr:MarR family winged helix-turn-helix transcriptional regulator [Hymenobacter sp. GOD-10R]WRQ31259.1 MarR family winged helix-turn-helix transcriptional regulator [Hymenobacter sp. GOD-10R]